MADPNPPTTPASLASNFSLWMERSTPKTLSTEKTSLAQKAESSSLPSKPSKETSKVPIPEQRVMAQPIRQPGPPKGDSEHFKKWFAESTAVKFRRRPTRRTAVDPRVTAMKTTGQEDTPIQTAPSGPNFRDLMTEAHEEPQPQGEPAEDVQPSWLFAYLYDNLDEYDNPREEKGLDILKEDLLVDMEDRIRRFYGNPTAEEKEQYERDATGFIRIGRPYRAVYLGPGGDILLPQEYGDYKIQQKISFNVENHISHIRIHANAKLIAREELRRREQAARAEQAAKVNQPANTDTEQTASENLDWNTYQDTQQPGQTTQQEPEVGDIEQQENIEQGNADDQPAEEKSKKTFIRDLDTFDDVFEDPADSPFKTLSCLVHWESFKALAIFDFSLESMSKEATECLAQLPEETQQYITEMRNTDQKPIMVNFAFDFEKAASKLVNIATPVWAGKLADCVKSGYCGALLAADDSTIFRIDILHSQLKMQMVKGDPLNRFHTGKKRDQYTDIKLVLTPQIYGSTYGYIPRTFFFSKREYLTQMAIHVLAEKKGMAIQAAEYAAGLHKLRLVELPHLQNEYFGFLPIPDANFRLSEGDKLTFLFAGPPQKEKAKEEPVPWKGHVVSDAVTIGPHEYVKLLVRRPWDREGEKFDPTSVRVVPLKGRTPGEAPASIHLDPGNDVTFQVELSDRIQRNILYCIEDMNFEAATKPRQPWNDDIEVALLCKDYSQLPARDIFASVRKQFPNVVDLMELNEKQKLAVQMARTAPGGLLCIQGPPGTGKSKMLREMSIPFLRSEEIQPVLIISPANSAADSIANRMNLLLMALKKNKVIPKNRYGIRPYSANTDKAIRNLPAKATRPEDPFRRPKVSVELIDDLTDCAKEIVRLHTAETYRPFEGINDDRVKLPDLSPGKILLQVTGVIQSDLTFPNNLRFAVFRSLYNDFAHGRDYDSARFDAAADDAWSHVMQHASFIVGTTAGCGLERVIGKIKNHVRLIMVDEAAHQREDQLVPYFAARLSVLNGFIQVGDFLQLPPPMVDNIPLDIFSEQQKYSFMTRLISTGFPAVCELQVQHRFVEDICALANELVYGEKLLVANDAKVENRQVARAFQNKNAGYVKDKRSIMLIDVPPCKANKTQVTSTNSRWNELIVMTNLAICRQLMSWHQQASIAYMSGYLRQTQCMKTAHANMVQKNVPGSDRLTVTTIDSAQGEQWDYVVIDLLIHDDKLGFLSDFRRLNVALTRARNGLVLVADVAAIRKCPKASRGFVSRLLNHIKPFQVTWPPYDELPPSAYYRPQELSELRVDTQNLFSETEKVQFIKEIKERMQRYQAQREKIGLAKVLQNLIMNAPPSIIPGQSHVGSQVILGEAQIDAQIRDVTGKPMSLLQDIRNYDLRVEKSTTLSIMEDPRNYNILIEEEQEAMDVLDNYKPKSSKKQPSAAGPSDWNVAAPNWDASNPHFSVAEASYDKMQDDDFFVDDEDIPDDKNEMVDADESTGPSNNWYEDTTTKGKGKAYDW